MLTLSRLLMEYTLQIDGRNNGKEIELAAGEIITYNFAKLYLHDLKARWFFCS
jgi:hypothetical protein